MIAPHWLDRIKSSERLLVGDKAFFLSQLLQENYPVLPGFVVDASVWKNFLEIVKESESLLTDFPDSSLHLDINDYQILQAIAKKSRQTIINSQIPTQWLEEIVKAGENLASSWIIFRLSLAINHSAINCFEEGQICFNNRESIALALKKTWARLFTAKNLFYWYKIGLGIEKINLAILVQPIQDAKASGIVKITEKEIVIEATWGLGHSINKGEVQPDYYEIDRNFSSIQKKVLGKKNSAYRLKKSAKNLDLFEDNLENYWLSREEQEKFALEDLELAKLQELIKKRSENSSNLGIYQWTLITNSEQPEFYLTKFTSLAEKIPKKNIFSGNNSSPIIQGIGVSAGIVTAPVKIISDFQQDLEYLAPGQIIVAKQIKDEWLPYLQTAKGLISERGGITSHMAIIARELGIPAMVNAANATTSFKTGEYILLDGNKGEVYLQEDYLSLSANVKKLDAKIQSFTPEIIATKLMVNISQISSIAHSVKMDVDGVGLLRSELMLLDLLAQKSLSQWLEEENQPQLVEKLTNLIAAFASSFAPKPVFYRFFDRHDRQSITTETTVNSLLGIRGTYYHLLKPKLLELELEALVRLSRQGFTNLRLILPFVRSLEEFKFCRRLIEMKGLISDKNFQIWLMVEVPSIIFLLPEYIQAGVQGIAIGSNDLTQLLLGVDREDFRLHNRLNASHQAMLNAFKKIIITAKNHHIPCSICGQAVVEYPEIIEDLIRWGITFISVETEALAQTRKEIIRAEKKILLENIHS